MQQRSHTGLIVFAVSMAVVALLVAVGAAAAGYVIVQRDHKKIHELQGQVRSLCNRKVVTGVSPSFTNFTVRTAKGC